MKTSENGLQQAIEDLALIRQAINGLGRDKTLGWGWSVSTANINLCLQITAFLLALIFLAAEFLSGNYLSFDMLTTAGDYEYQLLIIFQTGFSLLFLLFVLYIVIYKGARDTNQTWDDYIVKNFVYLKNFSFAADLFIKFSIFSLLLIADRPNYVFPVLFLFTADYLFQGRHFTLPGRISIIAGLLCLIAGYVQFACQSWSFTWPLTGFVLISLFSIINVLKQRKIVIETIKNGENAE